MIVTQPPPKVKGLDADLSRIVQAALTPEPSPPPVEAERATLAAVLLSFLGQPVQARVLPEVRALLGSVPEPFAVPAHAEVWRAICELADAGKPFDLATVSEYLRAHGGPLAPTAEQVSGLYDVGITSANACHYARVVAAAARNREAEHVAALLAGCLRNGDTADAAALAARVVELTTGSADEGLVPDNVMDADDPAPPIFQNGPAPGILALLLGDSGLGKTFAALGLAVSTATGYTVWPTFKPLRKLRVALVCAEDSKEILKVRILAICRAAHIPEAVVREAFAEGRLSVFTDIPGPLFTSNEYGAVTASATFEKLAAWCRKTKPDLLILDPFASVAEVPENDNQAVNAVAQELARFAARTGASVLLSHHTAKSTRGGEAGQHSARGASALPCRSKWTALLTREGKNLSFGLVKGSYGAPLSPVALERTADGALLEVDPRRALDRNAQELAQWLAANPSLAVTKNGLDKNQRGGAVLLSALDWTSQHGLDVLSHAEARGLVHWEERTPNGGGKSYRALVAGPDSDTGEEADNECPF